MYSKLLVRSADVESWGGGGGAWGALWAGQERDKVTSRLKQVC